MNKDLVAILKDIKKIMSKTYTRKNKVWFEKEIAVIIDVYNKLEIPEALNETYEGLKSEGKELMNESNIKDDKKVEYYLRHCRAAVYDFKGNLRPLNTILRSFLISVILFFILAPRYFPFLLPLIYILPIFFGFRGIKKRTMNGLLMGVSVLPITILLSIFWIINAFLTISKGKFSEFIAQLAKSYGFSQGFAQNLAIPFILLSIVMLISSLTLLYNAIKNRKMYV